MKSNYVFLLQACGFLSDSKTSCHIPINHIVYTAFFRFYIKLNFPEISFLPAQIIFPNILCDLDKILCGIGFTGKLYGNNFLMR